MLPIAPLAFGFGGPQDWIIILVVALLVFGPKKLPEVGREVGKLMRDFNKLKDELTGAAHSLHEEVESVIEPVSRPWYSQTHPVSSATVDAAVSKQRVYDQDPANLMAPVVPNGALLEPPSAEEHKKPILAEAATPTSAVVGEHEKGL